LNFRLFCPNLSSANQAEQRTKQPEVNSPTLAKSDAAYFSVEETAAEEETVSGLIVSDSRVAAAEGNTRHYLSKVYPV